MYENNAEYSEAINWLKVRIPDFCNLSDEEITVASDFFFMWSAFEWEALKGEASVDSIKYFAVNVLNQDRLDEGVVSAASSHFKNR